MIFATVWKVFMYKHGILFQSYYEITRFSQQKFKQGRYNKSIQKICTNSHFSFLVNMMIDIILFSPGYWFYEVNCDPNVIHFYFLNLCWMNGSYGATLPNPYCVRWSGDG